MNNTTKRLARASWKSKNNLYVLDDKYLDDTIMKDIDVLIYSDSQSLDVNVDLSNLLEVIGPVNQKGDDDIQGIIEDVKRIDKIDILPSTALGVITAMDLSKKYYWKNILILEHKD